MRAEFGAFLSVQCAFKQRAEYRGFDMVPLFRCRLDQQADFFVIQRNRGGVFEQIAIELQHGFASFAKPTGQTALIHRLP